MVEEQTIKCAACGKEVPRLHSKQKFCAACGAKIRKYRSYRKKPFVIHCAVCGEEVITNSGKTKYCRECADKIRRQQIRESDHQRDRRTFKTCLQCGKKFLAQSAKYCSQQCRNKAAKKAKEQRKCSKTLDDWLREAAECNLDYGTYRALRQAGKTYDELKATAGERRLQVHNSTAHQHFLRI